MENREAGSPEVAENVTPENVVTETTVASPTRRGWVSRMVSGVVLSVAGLALTAVAATVAYPEQAVTVTQYLPAEYQAMLLDMDEDSCAYKRLQAMPDPSFQQCCSKKTSCCPSACESESMCPDSEEPAVSAQEELEKQLAAISQAREAAAE